MDASAHRPAVLVAACGNAHAGDDAFGPMVAARLRRWPVDAEVIDLGMRPAALLDLLPGPDVLILVDAILDDRAVSREVLDVDWFESEPRVLAHDDALSSHGLGLADQLRLARTLGVLPPQVRLVGLRTPPDPGEATPPTASLIEEAARHIAARVASATS